MKTFTLPDNVTAEQMISRLVFLAWKASGVLGMGFLQVRDIDQTEKQVMDSLLNRDDYSGLIRGDTTTDVHCDYVQGRMMKFNARKLGSTSIEMTDDFRRDYQSFCETYPTAQSLFDAATESLSP